MMVYDDNKYISAILFVIGMFPSGLITAGLSPVPRAIDEQIDVFLPITHCRVEGRSSLRDTLLMANRKVG